VAKISILVTDNLLSENQRAKFAKIFGGKLLLLISSIPYKSRGFRVTNALKIRPRRGGEEK